MHFSKLVSDQELYLYDLDIIQIPFNIFDRRLLESGMIDILHDQGIEIHSRSVFLQGLLLMSEKDRPSIFTKWNKLWKVTCNAYYNERSPYVIF